jgi:hypothetical protein
MPTTEPNTHESRTSIARPAPAAAKGGALLTLFGLALVAAGAGLALGPRISWRVGRIAGELSELGLEAGAVAVGGLVLLGLASLRRAVESTRGESNPDDSLMLDQIATELVELRTHLEQLQSQTEGLGRQVADLHDEVDERTAAPQSLEGGSMPSDALFQLASSLDKLGARLDQRLRVHHATLQGSIDDLKAKVELTVRTYEERLGGVQPFAPAAPVGCDAGQGPAAERSECCDELAVSVPEKSLGVLDSIDDDVAAALPSGAAQRTPAGSWDEQLMVERPDDTREKLEQLQLLLADDRLRAALNSLPKA